LNERARADTGRRYGPGHGDGDNNAYPDNDDAQRVLDLLFEKILPEYYGD
jgi:hypothetical protein